MKMNLLLAWRNVWRNKARSLVIMASIAIGLTAGIFVLSLYKGMLTARVRTVIDSETGHLQLHHPLFTKDPEPVFIIHESESVYQFITSLPEVKSVSARSVVHGMLNSATGSAGVRIHGIDPKKEYEVSGLNKKIAEGKGFEEGKKNRIVIGKKLADKMKVKNTSKVVLTFTDTSGNIVSGAFRIAGIYESDNSALDEMNIYVDRSALNTLLGIDNQAHEISVLLKSDQDLRKTIDTIRKKFPSIATQGWNELSPETELMVNTVNEMSYIIIIIILFALAFGILNTMLMSVLERTREIGMMVALGMSKWKIFILIMNETALLTIVGAPVGLIAGSAIINHYNRTGLNFASEGKEMMQSFGFSTIIYPEFPSENLTFIITMVIITAIVSSLVPAVKALRMRPVEALRK